MKLLISIFMVLCLAVPAGADMRGFEEKECEDKIVQTMEVRNPEGQLSHLSFILDGGGYSMIWSNLSVSDVKMLWADLLVLEKKHGIKEINLFINSPGGDAFAGLALADQIHLAKKRGIKITAHASGVIASAAVPVYAMCDIRMAAPGTIFMVHEVSLWKWPGRETASDISAQNELIQLLRSRYIKILADKSDLSIDEWSKMEKQTKWFSVDDAVKWGLVDSIE
jgi:ATP-dependent Clp protease protease subunit